MILKLLDENDVVVGAFEMDYIYKFFKSLKGKCSGNEIRFDLEKNCAYYNESKSAFVCFKKISCEELGL